MLKKRFVLLVSCMLFVFALSLAPLMAEGNEVIKGNVGGYMNAGHEKAPETFNAGYSIYSAAWPLLQKYPGHSFQTGLFGTWMFAQNDKPAPAKMYSDIEGGLGWWRATQYPTITPKFIMGGVALNFREWANGPGSGKGKDWDNPKGHYGVAQLSPWLLFPPDGLNLKQGTCGELFGYGYLPLPLTEAKSTTAGEDVPTGNHSWTLFLNTGNFKGPAAFFTPYFWSANSVVDSRMSGMFLDSRPSKANRHMSMETQHIPCAQVTDSKGETYARMAPTSFPLDANGDSVILNNVTSYNKKALWDGVKAWFEGGKPVSGAIDPAGANIHKFNGHGGNSWKIYMNHIPKDKRSPLDVKSSLNPTAINPVTYGFHCQSDLATKTRTKDGVLMTLPEYYKLVKDGSKNGKWVAVAPKDVPAETGLAKVSFERSKERPPHVYVTPEGADSCWKKPGPVAGPFKVKIGDGSTVTYFWYRFVDQPSLLKADMTDKEREALQKRVEKLHRNWTKDRDYLAPPTTGKLADIDPALIVTPPKGMEAGYVPIVTGQGFEG